MGFNSNSGLIVEGDSVMVRVNGRFIKCRYVEPATSFHVVVDAEGTYLQVHKNQIEKVHNSEGDPK